MYYLLLSVLKAFAKIMYLYIYQQEFVVCNRCNSGIEMKEKLTICTGLGTKFSFYCKNKTCMSQDMHVSYHTKIWTNISPVELLVHPENICIKTCYIPLERLESQDFENQQDQFCKVVQNILQTRI